MEKRFKFIVGLLILSLLMIILIIINAYIYVLKFNEVKHKNFCVYECGELIDIGDAIYSVKKEGKADELINEPFVDVADDKVTIFTAGNYLINNNIPIKVLELNSIEEPDKTVKINKLQDLYNNIGANVNFELTNDLDIYFDGNSLNASVVPLLYTEFNGCGHTINIFATGGVENPNDYHSPNMNFIKRITEKGVLKNLKINYNLTSNSNTLNGSMIVGENEGLVENIELNIFYNCYFIENNNKMYFLSGGGTGSFRNIVAYIMGEGWQFCDGQASDIFQFDGGGSFADVLILTSKALSFTQGENVVKVSKSDYSNNSFDVTSFNIDKDDSIWTLNQRGIPIIKGYKNRELIYVYTLDDITENLYRNADFELKADLHIYFDGSDLKRAIIPELNTIFDGNGYSIFIDIENNCTSDHNSHMQFINVIGKTGILRNVFFEYNLKPVGNIVWGTMLLGENNGIVENIEVVFNFSDYYVQTELCFLNSGGTGKFKNIIAYINGSGWDFPAGNDSNKFYFTKGEVSCENILLLTDRAIHISGEKLKNVLKTTEELFRSNNYDTSDFILETNATWELQDSGIPSLIENDLIIASNSVTKYKIVLPDNADNVILFAAEELVNNFYKASGITLSTVTDAQINSEQDDNFISIGKTVLLETVDLGIPFEILDMNGTYIGSNNSNIFCYGNTSIANLYAVYDLMEVLFDYEYYASDEIYVEPFIDKLVKPFSKINLPDFQNRTIGYYDTENSGEHRQRLKVEGLYDGWDGMYGHTYFKIVPPQNYKTIYPNWYSPNDNGRNLCLSNVDIDIFVENLKTIIEQRPLARYIMIGQEDTQSFCECNKCKQKIEYFIGKGASDSGAKSAIMIDFSNQVANKISEWINQYHPERKDLLLVSFAYNETREAPVKEIDGAYYLIDNSLIPPSNLAIMIIPYNASYSCNFYDKDQRNDIRGQLQGWASMSENLFIWMYDINFENYLLPFMSWRSLSENYKILKELNVFYIYNQSSYNISSLNFSQMKQWIQAKLLWDTSLNVDVLIEEFVSVFYKEAAPFIYKYFCILEDKFKELQENGRHQYSFNWDSTFISKDIFSKEFLLECKTCLDQAFSSLNFYKESDLSLYNRLYERVLRETIFVRKTLIALYPEAVNAQEFTQIEIDCQKLGLNSFTEF